jgi:quercetin dioxygenase-like cupin family protein
MAVEQGDGWALAHLSDLGDGPGFRKIRGPLGVTAFGVNAVVMPAGYRAHPHRHERPEELYFVHRGTLEFEFGDGATHRVGPGGVVRVSPSTVRRIANVGDGEAVYVAIGGADGYVGRDGIALSDEEFEAGRG